MCDTTQRDINRKNPFFEPYNTPHDTVPFDRIALDDYEEAFMEGIRRDDEEIEKTVNNPEVVEEHKQQPFARKLAPDDEECLLPCVAGREGEVPLGREIPKRHCWRLPHLHTRTAN